MNIMFETLPSYGGRIAEMTRATSVVTTPSRGIPQTSSIPATGAAAMRSRGLLKGKGYDPYNPTPYLVILVLAEAFALVGFRHGFRHYHGG